MRNWVIALGLAGCYHSNFEANVPCASDLSCPGTQVCDTTHVPPVCVGELGSGANPDASVVPMDGAITACGVCPTDQPVCDADSTTCRGCYQDAECSSHVCSESTGSCIPESQTLYVKNGGNDANPCTHDAPCANISRAVTLVDATHDVIKIYDGDYNDSWVSTATYLLSGEGNSNSNAYINYRNFAGHDHVLEIDGGTVLVEGLGLDGGKAETVRAQGGATLTLFDVEVANSPIGSVDAAASNVTLYNVELHDNVGTEAGVNINGGQLTMLRNVLYNLDGACVRVSNAKYDVENSILAGCVGEGFAQVGTTSNPAVFAFNTLATNMTGVTCMAAITVKNTIFANNGMAPQTPACATVTYSLFNDAVVPGVGNLAGDPQFVAADDLHINFGSPARDKADPASTQTEDFDGEHRPHGVGFDIGADEHY